MNENEDKLSFNLLRYINILMVNNPERTVLGLLLGIMFAFLTKLFEPYLNTIKFINVNNISLIGWLPFGIVLVHLPQTLWSIFTRPIIKDEIDDLIRLVEKSNLSDKEKRIAYRNIVNKCIDSISKTKKPKITIESVNSETDN